MLPTVVALELVPAPPVLEPPVLDAVLVDPPVLDPPVLPLEVLDALEDADAVKPDPDDADGIPVLAALAALEAPLPVGPNVML